MWLYLLHIFNLTLQYNTHFLQEMHFLVYFDYHYLKHVWRFRGILTGRTSASCSFIQVGGHPVPRGIDAYVPLNSAARQYISMVTVDVFKMWVCGGILTRGVLGGVDIHRRGFTEHDRHHLQQAHQITVSWSREQEPTRPINRRHDYG